MARLVSYNLSALAFKRPPAPFLPHSFLLLAPHALGMAVVAQLTRTPMWMVGVVLGVLVAAQFILHARDILSPALLAPFWFVYFAAAARFVYLRLGGEVVGYFEYLPPDPRVLLSFEFLIGAALIYASLILCVQVFGAVSKGLRVAALVLAAVVLVWAAAEYFGHRTFGATGSDPYAYVQMGIDVFTRGTAAHRFALFPLIAAEKISWYPIVHVGYHLPYNVEGDAVTVWSVGGALAYGLAYRVAGEGALYLVNPFFSLLSVLVSGGLAWELTRSETRTMRIIVACGTAAIVATSNELVNWAGVTMVDTQALLFSTLAFYCAVRVYRTGKWDWALGAGLCWGTAYFVRHTQLVIGLGLLPLFLLGAFTNRIRLRNLVLLGIGAFLMAIPDLWYHQIYLGSWLTPESEELALFSLSAIPTTLAALGQSTFIGAEFGWLLLFIVAGIVLFLRRNKTLGIALLLWLAATLLIHLPYPALRLRDLLPEFPIVVFYAVYGAVAGVVVLLRSRREWFQVAGTAILFLALEFGLVRVWNTVPRVWQAPPARFGAMTQPQRASFDMLAQLTPPNAIIGASLNSGAVELYAHRDAFRPADWCNVGDCSQAREFLQVTQGARDDVYLLEDNAALAPVLDALRQDYQVERITTLNVPLFGTGTPTNAGALWKISR